MSDSPYIIRNYRHEDFNKLVQLGAETQKLKKACCRTSLQGLIENLGQPNHFPEDDVFVVEIAGNIVGYIDVMNEQNIRRAVLSCLIHSEHCGKDFAARLVEYAIHRASELRAKVAHVNIPQDNAMAKDLFSSMGFRFVRRFLDLRLDLKKAHLMKINQSTYPHRSLRPGEEDTLTQIQNRSFADTWGYNPNTVQEIIYRTRLPNCSLGDIIVFFDKERAICYCWMKMNLGEDKAVSGGKGRIYMLGVDPDYRGKGIGKQVLLVGLSYLKPKICM